MAMEQLAPFQDHYRILVGHEGVEFLEASIADQGGLGLFTDNIREDVMSTESLLHIVIPAHIAVAARRGEGSPEHISFGEGMLPAIYMVQRHLPPEVVEAMPSFMPALSEEYVSKIKKEKTDRHLGQLIEKFAKVGANSPVGRVYTHCLQWSMHEYTTVLRSKDIDWPEPNRRFYDLGFGYVLELARQTYIAYNKDVIAALERDADNLEAGFGWAEIARFLMLHADEDSPAD
jgi:hypothetical protein